MIIAKSMSAIALLFALAAHADQNLNTLLAQPQRPTIPQVVAVQSSIQEEAGIPIASREGNMQAWLDVMVAGAPRVLAAMEYAFPGATWAFVGRDTQALADIFETFYLANGMPDRVIRIGVSKASFVKANPADLAVLVESHGLNLNTLTEKHPFILVDTISKGFGRQGRMLLDAVYRKFEQNGGAPATLIKRFNMIGLKVSTTGQGLEIPFEASRYMLDAEVARYQVQRPQSFGDEHKIVTVPDNEQRFNESGYVHFVGGWHDSYGVLRAQGSRMMATIGAPYDVTYRKSVLWLQKNIIREFSSANFLKRVQAEAKKLGFTVEIPRNCTNLLKTR